MTSRTTPVGVVVLVLASLIVVGCSAQTSAVFEALVDPARAPASPAEGDTDGAVPPEGGDEPVWWPHPDGYAMTLPAGWSGVAVSRPQADRLIDAVAATHDGAAERIRVVLADTRSRVSAVAADTTAPQTLAPLLLVVAQPTEGRRAHGVKTRVQEQISELPGIQGVPARTDVRLPAGSGVKFEYLIIDADLGAIRVSSYLFRFGSQAYLVSFVAAAGEFDEAEPIFEAIAASLRFGV